MTKTEQFLRSCGAKPITEMGRTPPALDVATRNLWQKLQKRRGADALWYFSAAALKALRERGQPENQRVLNPKYAEQLAMMIGCGEWICMISPLLFLESMPDKLADGQHRLDAAIKSGVPGIVFSVLDDLPDQALSVQSAKKADKVYEVVYRQLKQTRGVKIPIGKVKQLVSLVQLWFNPCNPRRTLRQDITVLQLIEICKQLWDRIYPVVEQMPSKCKWSKPPLQLAYLLVTLEGAMSQDDLRHCLSIIVRHTDPRCSRFKIMAELRDYAVRLYSRTQNGDKPSSVAETLEARKLMCTSMQAFRDLADGRRHLKLKEFTGTAEEVMAFEHAFRIKHEPKAAWCRPL